MAILFLTICCLLIASAVYYFTRHKSSINDSKNEPQYDKEDQLLKILKINYRGALANFEETMHQRRKKSKEFKNRMPSFMFEATEKEAVSFYDLPEEIRLALRQLRIFISDNPSITLRVLKEAETIHFDNEELIFTSNMQIKHIYIVIYGTVSLKAKLNDNRNIEGVDCSSSIEASAVGECGLVKVPIEFFTHNGQKMKLIETAVSRIERFVYHVLICTFDLVSYVRGNISIVKCFCGNCDNIEFLVENSRGFIEKKLEKTDANQLMIDDIMSSAQVIVYRMKEPVIEKNNYLMFISHGSMEEYIQKTGHSKKLLYRLNSGEFIDFKNLFLVRNPSIYKLQAQSENTSVIVWPAEEALRLMNKYPSFLNIIIEDYIDKYGFFYKSLEWLNTHIEFARDSLIKRPETSSKGIFTIISGRVRAITTKSTNFGNSYKQVEELGQGDSIGINDVLLQTENIATPLYIAIRFTSVVFIHSTVVLALESLLSNSAALLTPLTLNRARMQLVGRSQESTMSQGMLANVKTVAIVGGNDSVNIEKFATYLDHHVKNYSQSTIVSSSILAKKFGIQNSNNLEHISSTRITHFLSTAEDENKILIMITDSESMTKWNIHALEQADVIIVAINFEDQPYSPQALELKIMNQELKTTREIVFLHSHSTKQIRNTKQWLQSRKGYHMHFHVRCDESFFDYATSNSDKIESCSHIGRLARYLTGKTVGIACGGGGAKGFAHLGVLKAFSESNIPIDMITGTSMGAFLGGLWAMCEDLEEVYRQTTEAVNYSKSWLIYCFDLTLPVVSIFTGRQFGYILKQVFGDCNLEDFWTPYMCVTTDLTEECGKAHNFGSAALFIQASMTLIGYVPPVSDPSNNHLLVDGGYTNNVPVNELVTMGCNRIFAVGVGGCSIGKYKSNHGTHLSGLVALFNCLNPFRTFTIPTYMDIQLQLAFICATKLLQDLEISSKGQIVFLKPKVQHFSNFEFKQMDKIREIGLVYAREHIASLKCIECFIGYKVCPNCSINVSESFQIASDQN